MTKSAFDAYRTGNEALIDPNEVQRLVALVEELGVLKKKFLSGKMSPGDVYQKYKELFIGLQFAVNFSTCDTNLLKFATHDLNQL